MTVAYAQGATALEDISLSFAAGEQVAVIGPSGAGKTTLLHVLGCSVRPTRGKLRILDAVPWELSRSDLHRFRRNLFVAPQLPPLPPRQRVVHAVLAGRLPRWTLWQSLRSLVAPRDLEEVAAALARFDVQDKIFLRCDRLSGGERQRVGLARLLLSDARLLLLDEPVSALDPALALTALETLQAEATARGATLVVSLHAVDLALARFSRLIGVRAGTIAFDLPRAQVDSALLEALYGRELGASLQDPSIEAARLKLPNCR
ncbi:MAG: ATP-binding cassette domain-containing protein [Pseudomonadota bacterium]|nr:ATP-binding cassette domain-containing protein [Pseudomonadota bacterium]